MQVAKLKTFCLRSIDDATGLTKKSSIPPKAYSIKGMASSGMEDLIPPPHEQQCLVDKN
jgi:hypothetical protein